MKYLVLQYEIHCVKYVVSADSKEEAVSAVLDDEGTMLELEYIEVADNYGTPIDELGIDRTKLQDFEIVTEKCLSGKEIIPSIYSVKKYQEVYIKE